MLRGLRGTRLTPSILIFILVQLLGSTSAYSQFNFLTFWKHRVTVAPFTWTGAGGNSNWNNTANWSTIAVPGASDTAHFVQSVCTPNCNVTINTSVNVAGIDMQAFYLGTISQGANAMTIGSAGWSQASGTFTGGSSNITVNGNMTLSGGTFTSTSATANFTSNFTASGSPTFTHNSGTVSFTPASSGTSIQTGTMTFNNLNFAASGQTYTLTGSTITSVGALTIGDTSSASSFMNGGTINAQGNVTFSNYGYAGTTLININGSSNQTITGVSTAQIPNFQIASTGGTVTFSGTLLFTGNYIYTSGSVVAFLLGGSSSTLVFQNSSGTPTITPGNSVNYGNVSILGSNSSYTISGTLNVAKNFVMGDTGSAHKTINSGTIIVAGNLTSQNYGYEGTAVIQTSGGSQTISGVVGAGIPPLTIASSGTVTFSGTLNLTGNYIYTSGTISSGSSTLLFSRPGSAYTITPGSGNYNNVSFTNTNSSAVATLTGTFNVGGNLSFASSSSAGVVNGGGFSVTGNVSYTNFGESGSATLSFVGSGSTTLSIAGTSSILSGAITVNKSGSGAVALSTAANFNASSQAMNVTAGTVNMGGFNMNVSGALTVASAGSVYCQGGTLTEGSLTMSGVVDCAGVGFSWTGLAGDHNWNTAGNWSGGAVPGSSNTAVFGSQCAGAACNATVNANISVNGIKLSSSYTGTLTQGSSNTMTLSSYGWSQDGGTFTGSNANISTQSFSQTAGTFTSTSGNLQFLIPSAATATLMNQSGGTFAHNNGTVSIYSSCAYASPSYTVTTTSGQNFYNLSFGGNDYSCNPQRLIVTNPINVVHNFSLSEDYGGTGVVFDSGTINLTGSASMLTGALPQGSGTLNIVGNSAQTYTGPGYFPNIVMNTTGSFSPAGGTTNIGMTSFTLQQGSFTAPTGTLKIYPPTNSTTVGFNITGGSFAHNNGTVLFYGSAVYGSNYLTVTAPSGFNLYNLSFGGTAYSGNANSNTITNPVNVANNLTISNDSASITSFDSGVINLSGNLFALSGSSPRMGGTVNIVGNAAQTFTGPGAAPNIVVNTTGSFGPSGTTNIGFTSLTIQQGVFTAPTGSLTLWAPPSPNLNIFSQTGGTFVHNNGTIIVDSYTGPSGMGYLTLNGPSGLTFKTLVFNTSQFYGNPSYFYTTNPINVTDFKMESTNGSGSTDCEGTFNVSGNVYALTGAYGGGGTLNIVGNGTQTYTGPASLPNVVVNTTGTFGPASGTTNIGMTTLAVQQGAFTAPTGTLTITPLSNSANTVLTAFNLAGGSFTHNSGTVTFNGYTGPSQALSATVTGSSLLSFYNLNFSSSSFYGNGTTYHLGQNMNVANAMTLSQSSTALVAMSGHNLTTGSLSLPSLYLSRDGGVLTVGGSPVGAGSYGGGTITN